MLNKFETIALPYRGPFDWAQMLRYFAQRAMPGVEAVVNSKYLRTVRLNNEMGILQISHDDGALSAAIGPNFGEIDETTIIRLRSMFDLDSDLGAVNNHLSRDPGMSMLVAAHTCLRIPGGWDPFEVAIRAVLGQQVSIAAARVLANRLVERCGEDLGSVQFPELSRLFPTPSAIAAADLTNMGMPGARANTLKAIAESFLDDPLLFEKGRSADDTVNRLRQIKGVGEWTAQYIAIRACRKFDAFPAGDAGILRGLADDSGVRPHQKDVLTLAEAWRPYRAYAAHHLWAKDAAGA